MAAFVHPAGICDTNSVGDGTRIWAFAHVLAGAKIGRDCNICDHVFVENDVVIGDRVTVKCGVQVWDGVHLDDDVFVGPNATFTNDQFPRSKTYQAAVKRTHVEKGASIGANATILPGIRIGSLAMVGAGAVVTHDVPQMAIVVGNPARIVGYVNTSKVTAATTRALASAAEHAAREDSPLSVPGVKLSRLRSVVDLRGRLCAGEFEDQIPFEPKRYFFVFDVPSTDVRGEHAHRTCEQFLVCVRGSVAVIVDNGYKREEILLATPDIGIYMPAMIWGTQYRYSADAVLLVFASQRYDPADYIRDYSDFLRTVRESPSQVTSPPG